MRILVSILLVFAASAAQADPFWWSTPTELSEVSAQASEPRLAVSSSGSAVCLYVSHVGDKRRLQMAKMPFEQSWTTPIILKETGVLISNLQVVMNNSGQIAAIWREGSRLFAQIFTFDGHASLETLLCEGKGIGSSHLAMNDKGEVVVVWERRNENKRVIESARAQFGAVWTAPEIISHPEGEAHSPKVALNDAGTLVIVWEQQGIQARVDDVTLTLSQPGVQGKRPQIAINKSGEMLALWQREEGFASSVEVAQFDLQGGWSIPQIISSEGENASEPTMAFNDSGEALVAWRSSNGETLQVCGVRRKSNQPWSRPKTLSHQGINALSPQAVLNNKKNGMIIWRRSIDGTSIVEAATLAQESIWSEPFSLFDERDHASQAALALNDQGQGVIVWRQKEKVASFIQAESFTWNPEEQTLPKEIVSVSDEPVPAPLPPPPPPAPSLPPPPPPPLPKKRASPHKTQHWLVEVRGSAYYPQEKLFREVYNDVLVNGGLLVAYSFFKRWAVVASGEYMKRSGQTVGLRDRTEMQLIPLSLLIRYKYLIRSGYHLYAGIGPRLFIFKETVKSGVFEGSVTEHVVGGVAETGVLIRVGKVDLDIFAAYSYGKKRIENSKTNIDSNSPNLGGLQLGLGLGFSF